MAERKQEVGACGNYCGACIDFLAWEENNDILQQEVAQKLTKELGRNILPTQVGCQGCWGNIHNDISASHQCGIRQCVLAKGFATCAECKDFPCNTFSKQFDFDSKCAKNIRAIKTVLYN